MNNKFKKIAIIYISLIILISLAFAFYNIYKNQKENNTGVSADNSENSSVEEIVPVGNNESKNLSEYPSEIDPVSGERFNKDVIVRSTPQNKDIDSIFILGIEILRDKTSIPATKMYEMQKLYNKMAKEKGKKIGNPLDVRVYKDSPIESQQTNDSITYTFKTYIDGEDYYSAFKYDINDKVNLKILTEDKSQVLHEYSR